MVKSIIEKEIRIAEYKTKLAQVTAVKLRIVLSVVVVNVAY